MRGRSATSAAQWELEYRNKESRAGDSQDLSIVPFVLILLREFCRSQLLRSVVASEISGTRNSCIASHGDPRVHS
jgi:hypothetical protein